MRYAPVQREPDLLVDGLDVAAQYVSDLHKALECVDLAALGYVIETVVSASAHERTVYLAGNGGSAAAAAHMAVDWLNVFTAAGRKATVVNLAGSAALLTALGNDIGFEDVFARQLTGQATAGDLLVLLSVSGASPNLIRAAETARACGMTTLGLLGSAGDLAELCDAWALLGDGDFGLTEDLHVAVNHMVVRAIRGGAPHRCRPSAQDRRP